MRRKREGDRNQVLPELRASKRSAGGPFTGKGQGCNYDDADFQHLSDVIPTLVLNGKRDMNWSTPSGKIPRETAF
jgi:hypothetical protein